MLFMLHDDNTDQYLAIGHNYLGRNAAVPLDKIY